MQGTAQLRAPSSRALASVVTAILALAFAAFPVFAAADSGSAGVQYNDRLPTGCGGSCNKPPPKHHHHNDTSNNGPSNSGGGGGGSGGGGGGSSSPSGGNSTPPSKSPQSEGAGGSTGQSQSARSGVAPTQGNGNGALSLNGSNAGYQSANNDGGGSSPLAGILVGLGLGAIVSIVFVVMRARRQRGQSEAVQSPNAS